MIEEGGQCFWDKRLIDLNNLNVKSTLKCVFTFPRLFKCALVSITFFSFIYVIADFNLE